MEVTKSNFAAVLPDVKEAIAASDFLSFDLEFTGLTLGGYLDNHPVDLLEERYKKLKENSSAFTITQFGLSAFTWDATENKYVARTWNFYLFPRPYGWCDRRFTCQAASLQFLLEHKFDFNKFIYEGVGYLSRYVEGKMRPQVEEEIQKLLDAASQEALPDIVPTNPRDVEFVAGIKASIDGWLQGDGSEPLLLIAPNSFLRRLVYQEVRGNYPELNVEKVQGTWDNMSISRMSEEEKARRRAELVQQKRDEFEAAIGFRQVWEAMSASRKPVVGHNLLLDLLYSYFHFEDRLPSSFRNFKVAINKVFPTIFDTKHIAATDPAYKDRLLSTGLGDVYAAVKGGVNVVHAEGFDRYRENEEYAHEAGFDAYMTGAIFAAYLEQIVGAEAHIEGVPLVASARILQYANTINQYGACSVLRLDRPEDENDFSNVFHVSINQRPAQAADVMTLFDGIPVQLKWINKTSTWVIINDRSVLPRVWPLVKQQLQTPKARSHGFVVRSFADFKAGKSPIDWPQLAKAALAGLALPLGLAFALHRLSGAAHCSTHP
ncbi:ribonuclease, putative [Acanthamoeba castellanii str. Neff]|uniref:Ribonuclease, putative n=1 Tax=Acanthamoeba castellanii (strain ATCC 30010 / Neff) TaxID=1257118 RepID=L8HCQ5_ACACF|nr:ribonuclease, putative [Acanthamoeba castellanii str. Neff]ELR22146.1 ribonuclease, putative [Acanthamoeba castellanii str. Neff]